MRSELLLLLAVVVGTLALVPPRHAGNMPHTFAERASMRTSPTPSAAPAGAAPSATAAAASAAELAQSLAAKASHLEDRLRKRYAVVEDLAPTASDSQPFCSSRGCVNCIEYEICESCTSAYDHPEYGCMICSGGNSGYPDCETNLKPIVYGCILGVIVVGGVGVCVGWVVYKQKSKKRTKE
ncbi:hypothetical protein Pelo_1125 [Pelomyxa schiedti]|nr:hypothetical protein Pelo_1125 [Pelomyxa schiedti]